MDLFSQTMNINLLNEDFLKKAADILQQTFQIDLNEIYIKVGNLSLEDKQSISESIHYICLNIMKNFELIPIHYFPSINNAISYLNLNTNVTNYLLENVKLNLHISTFYSGLPNEPISFRKCIEHYFYEYETNRKLTEKELNEPRTKVLSYILPRYRTLLKGFKTDNNNLAKNNIFFDRSSTQLDNKSEPYSIYQSTSDIFAYSIDNWVKNRYNLEDYINYKTNSYKYLRLFVSSFLEKNPDIKDLYFFERIYNILFTFNMYFFSKSFTENMMTQQLFEIIHPTIYLPNVFANSKLQLTFINMYNEFYHHNIDEFKTGLRKYCLDLCLFFIPLYNMVYSIAVDKYIKINQISAKEFLTCYLSLDKIVSGYNNMYSAFINEDDFNKYFPDLKGLLNEKRLNSDINFTSLSLYITKFFDFNVFNQIKIIDAFGRLNKDFTSLAVSDINKHQEIIKNFFLDIIANTNLSLGNNI
jgi:hypothetical protein